VLDVGGRSMAPLADMLLWLVKEGMSHLRPAPHALFSSCRRERRSCPHSASRLALARREAPGPRMHVPTLDFTSFDACFAVCFGPSISQRCQTSQAAFPLSCFPTPQQSATLLCVRLQHQNSPTPTTWKFTADGVRGTQMLQGPVFA